jgi:hypothetical protein
MSEELDRLKREAEEARKRYEAVLTIERGSKWRRCDLFEACRFMEGRKLKGELGDEDLPAIEDKWGAEGVEFEDGTRVACESSWNGPYSPETPDIDANPPVFWIYGPVEAVAEPQPSATKMAKQNLNPCLSDLELAWREVTRWEEIERRGDDSLKADAVHGSLEEAMAAYEALQAGGKS